MDCKCEWRNHFIDIFENFSMLLVKVHYKVKLCGGERCSSTVLLSLLARLLESSSGGQAHLFPPGVLQAALRLLESLEAFTDLRSCCVHGYCLLQ